MGIQCDYNIFRKFNAFYNVKIMYQRLEAIATGRQDAIATFQNRFIEIY